MASDPKDPQKQLLPIVQPPVETKLGMPGSDLVPTLVPAQLRETRRVAIGKKDEKVRQTGDGKGTWRAPMKLDHFLVTLKEQDERGDFVVDDVFHKQYGMKPKEIPIQLLFDRIHLNLMSYLGYYTGRKAFCKGNGQVAQRLQQDGSHKPVECPCNFLTEGKCKPHMVFQFRLPGMDIGECAKFRTTGKSTMKYIQGGLWMVKQSVAEEMGCSVDEAPLKNIPLRMKWGRESIVGKDGQARVIPVVSVGFAGTEDDLRAIAGKRQRVLKETQIQLIELERRRYRELLLPEPMKEAAMITEEFHPEQADEPPPQAVIELSPAPKKQVMIEEAAKAAMADSTLPKGFQEALEKSEDGEPEESERTPRDADLPVKPKNEKKPDKEDKGGWL
jgi:hypothetical protein